MVDFCLRAAWPSSRPPFARVATSQEARRQHTAHLTLQQQQSPSGMDSIYTTLPLDRATRAIRLLELLPAQATTDRLRCRLRNVSLDSNAGYMALSYVWGDPNVTNTVDVDGVKFSATVNLCAALKKMRNDSESRHLWVDAICINQADKVEKSFQIQLMADIYREAACVIIWLGERDAYSDMAMGLMFGAARLSDERRDDAKAIMSHALGTPGTLAALGLFLTRHWWNRIWIIQEAAVPRLGRKMFLCGDKPLLWDDFKKAYLLWSLMFKDESLVSAPNTLLGRLKQVIEGTSARTILWQCARLNSPHDSLNARYDSVYGLLEMLEESWNFDSTDPRDKAYAWIGLLRDTDIVIVPDYTAPVAMVFAGLVKKMLELKASLTLVAYTGSALRALPPIEGLPSWAPDLRRDAIKLGQQIPYWLRPKSFRASSDLLAVGSISDDCQTLTTSALMVGRAELIDAEQEADSADPGSKFCRWLYLALGSKSKLSPDIGPPNDALFRVLASFWHDSHLGLAPVVYRNQLVEMDYLRLGFMVYAGYHDRMQDYLERRHEEAALDTNVYLLRELQVAGPSGPQRIAVLGSASDALPDVIRPPHSRLPKVRTEKIPEKPQVSLKPDIGDFDNILRFFQMWDMDFNPKSTTCTYSCLVQKLLCESDLPSATDKSSWQAHAVEQLKGKLLDRVQAFKDCFTSRTSCKALFITNTGYIGLGPSVITDKDLIYVIRGCSMPLVVRKEAGGESFEILSHCYTWGAMYGEIVERMQAGRVEWETLRFH